MERIMSETSTTSTTPLELDPATLVLVRVREDYLRTSDAYAPVFARALALPAGEERDNLLTFYATTADTMGDGWATLIEPADSDRAASGFWGLSAYDYRRVTGLDVLTHKGWHIQRRYLGPVEGPDVPVEAPADLPVTFTQSDVDRLVREARDAMRREFEAWKEQANEVAITYAEENDLCGEFERCMEEIGFRGRTRDYSVSFSITVSARDEDSALEEAIEMLASDTYALRNAHDEVEEI